MSTRSVLFFGINGPSHFTLSFLSEMAWSCSPGKALDRIINMHSTRAEQWGDVQVTLGTSAPRDVTAKVSACPFSETHRRALSTPVQQRLPQFLVSEALGKIPPMSEEEQQKWYLSFKGQTSVSLQFDSQRVRHAMHFPNFPAHITSAFVLIPC
jgi:hypothetical protein